MTEYNYPPQAIGSYVSNQGRTPSWAGAGSQALSADRFNIGTSDYGRGYALDGFGQASSDFSRGGRRARSNYNNYQGDGRIQHDSRIYPNRFPSQHASISGRILDHNDMPPLEEYYEDIPSRHPSYQTGRTLSQVHNPTFSASYPAGPQVPNTYGGPPIRVPSSDNNYTRRRRRHSYSHDRYGSDGSYSSRSYSTDSLSSMASHSYYDTGNQYATVFPSHRGPTVVQPSQNLPIVVPINGGTGGYVVVPPAGQTMRVIDPSRPYKHLSIIDRILSPSTWGFGRKRGTIILN